MPKKACQGTPWYTVLSNVRYQNNFNYIGAFVGEREKLIEDGSIDQMDNNGEMMDDCKHIRFEQSDLIMILLNLAVIPDEVVRKMDLQPGWQKRFKALMDEYKTNFKGTPWRYQDQELEDQYAAFVKKQRMSDTDYMSWQDDLAARQAKDAAIDPLDRMLTDRSRR